MSHSSGVVDVVVVGGGGAGLTAAARAAHGGATVTVLEKQDECGGNTARSVGSVPGAGSRLQTAARIQDSPGQYVDDVANHIGGPFNREGLELLAGVSAELVHWLIDEIGIPLRLTEDYRHVGHGANRLHNPPTREGRELVAALRDHDRELGVEIRTSTPALGASRDGQDLVVETDGGEVRGRSLVLATDGFGADRAMMKEECSRYADLSYFGGAGNTGDGIRIGRSLGGRVADMSAVLGFAIMGLPRDSHSSWDTMVSWTVIEHGGVVVDPSGRRFGDESRGYSAFVDDIIDNAGPVVYAIFDRRVLDSVARREQRFRLLVERTDSPVLPLDPTAPPFGLDPEELASTLADYRAVAEGARTDTFGRTDTGWAPLRGQLYVARAEPSVLTTLGGLVVGEHGELLDEAGAAVPGVYAIGGTARTVSGSTGAGGYISGNGLLAALGYGYLAGAHAAATHGT